MPREYSVAHDENDVFVLHCMRKKTVTASLADLLFADSESSADALYLGKIFVPDPFISFRFDKRSYAVVNALEFGRVVNESQFDEVVLLEDIKEILKQKNKAATTAEVIHFLQKELGIKGFRVADDFPVGLADQLRKKKIPVEVAEHGLFPERVCKTAEELAHIKEGNRASAAGIQVAFDILKESTVKAGKIYYQNKVLTSEWLREEIDIACLRRGAVANHTIVAGGDQACDPHCAGYGPLYANQLIIIDVFPRVQKHGYHGDMTRTFLKGTPSKEQEALVKAVMQAQQKALQKIKAGVSGKTVHGAVQDSFNEAGYRTEKTEQGYVGFFHGTGHGLGLEVHEAPRVSSIANRLKKGHVVTVEPGLYYPGVGGCRIEDVVAIKSGGYEMLSDFQKKKWVLPR